MVSAPIKDLTRKDAKPSTNALAKRPPTTHLRITWPPTTHKAKRTRSLARLQSLSNAFTGPLTPPPRSCKASYDGTLTRPPQLGDLTLGPFLEQGQIWSAFSACTSRSASPDSLVVKLTSPTSCRRETLDEMLDEVWREDRLYTTSLAGLQGGRAPLVRGVWEPAGAGGRGGGGARCCARARWPGGGGGEARVGGLGVVDAYDALHEAGVLHNSCSPKHSLWEGERVMVVDFGLSTDRSEVGHDEWGELCREEIREVAARLGIS